MDAEADFIPFSGEFRAFDLDEDFAHDDVALGIDELVSEFDLVGQIFVRDGVATVSDDDVSSDDVSSDDDATGEELENGFELSIVNSEDEYESENEEEVDTEEVDAESAETAEPTTPYDCPICMETKCEDRDGVVKLGCSHKFCTQCFVTHMRGANQCAMCRAKVCEKPKKHKTKHMGVSERFGLVSELVWNSRLPSDIHDRIMNDARDRLIKASGNVETKYVSETMVRIKDFVREEDIRKASILSAFCVADRMSEWYGDESSSRIRVNWGGERFDIS
jgi:hypothetical protein